MCKEMAKRRLEAQSGEPETRGCEMLAYGRALISTAVHLSGIAWNREAMGRIGRAPSSELGPADLSVGGAGKSGTAQSKGQALNGWENSRRGIAPHSSGKALLGYALI